MRLQRYLAACGVSSRRRAEKLIEAGRVRINGTTAALGDVVDPAVDTVTCDGTRVEKESFVYLVLNKPRGVVTSVRDPHERKTVMDCVAGVRARVFPVGRLDMDVEGALLMTNDGELAYRLTHPSYEVEKVYVALVSGPVTREAIAKLEKGVVLEDGGTAPAKVTVLQKRGDATLLRLTLHEGRKREVKRLCAAVGHPVRDLRRPSIAGIHVEALRPGEWRYLNDHEIAALHKRTGLDSPRDGRWIR
jgi:pseudouridine synthase